MNDTQNGTPEQHELETRCRAAQRTPTTVNDGIDRRNFLSCMAWAGAGLSGPWPAACPLRGSSPRPAAACAQHKWRRAERFSFVQISDSHIGFNKAANQDVTGTLKLAIDKINALPGTPTFCCTRATSPTRPSRPSSTPRMQIVKGAKVGA